MKIIEATILLIAAEGFIMEEGQETRGEGKRKQKIYGHTQHQNEAKGEVASNR